jgi:hypothetical protein
MKIIQIAPVVEYRWSGNEDRNSHRIDPNEDATVYGLGDNGKVYVWGVKKSTYIKTEPNEDNDWSKGHYDKEYGWLESN